MHYKWTATFIQRVLLFNPAAEDATASLQSQSKEANHGNFDRKFY